MSDRRVNYEASGGIATIELDDPPANAYSFEMMQQLDAAILQARFDPLVHVLVLRGKGDKFFCAGADFAAQVRVYAEQFLPPRRSPRAIGAIKRAVQSGLEGSFHEGLALERELQQQLFRGADAREGLLAYAEKRKPEFTGA
jgi:enoyl-CoA hydratase/carnithine racemase